MPVPEFRFIASFAVLTVAGMSIAAPPQPGEEGRTLAEPALLDALIHPDHRSTGCVIHASKPEIGARGVIAADVVTILDNGSPSNRVDLVFVGDGYQESELGVYAANCQSGLNDLFTFTPFAEYANFFNAHRVEVISEDSGVDNDPDPGILRDTALNMGYWCNNIERLLCVNTFLAYQYADNAPDVDQVFAVANSTKYGGAGYPSADLGTYAGGNGLAPQIAIHELGHSMGDLADEYTYGGPVVWPGGEPSPVNASIFEDVDMQSMQRKWWDWLGSSDEGGVCGTFEGCNYSEQGIYRPTNNSMMRNLNRPFNNVSIEALILEIYRLVDPIDGASPPGVYNSSNTIEIQTVDPIGHALSIQWYADGQPVPGANGKTFSSSAYPLGAGSHQVSVTVVDNTPMVRDEAARQNLMTSSRSGWTVNSLVGDINGDCAVDTADLGGLVGAFGQSGPFGDLNGDGVVDTADLGLLITNFDQTCD